MAHREADRLWELAQGRLDEAEAQKLREHVAHCDECAEQLARISETQQILMPPEPPPLSEARWRAIDEKVMAAAARELEKRTFADRLRELFAPTWRPALGIAAAALIIVAAVIASRPEPGPVTMPVAVQEPKVVPAPQPIPSVPAPAPSATILAARQARSGAEPVAEQGVLAKGSAIETGKGGELWMALPDGSRAGLLDGSKAVLAELSPQHIRVELSAGSVAVAAVHAEQRTFEVASGDVVVRVVGTRFLVKRSGESTEVEVQEGKVEVQHGDHSRFLEGGHGLRIGKEGAFEEKLEAKKAKELAKVVPLRPVPVPVEPAPPQEPESSPDASVNDGWASAPVLDAGNAEVAEVASAQRDGGSADAGLLDGGKAGPADRTRAWLGKQFDKLKPTVDAVTYEQAEQIRIHDMETSANIGLCERALEMADAWIDADQTDAGYHGKNRDNHYRRVLLTKVRCLERLGRLEEARQLREVMPR